uniref:Uncharacterized protein n=1 Tax=Hyaloperonospora arabidopsidis (strain Emoy2) TaxID=559515 RepID=M4B219_HYAAE
MSPNDVGGDAHEDTPSVVADGQEMTNDHELKEKSAVPMAALDKMLSMLGDLSESVCRMESSQSAQGAGVNLQALEHTPPPKRSPNVSTATYFGVRRPAFAGVMVDTPDPVVTMVWRMEKSRDIMDRVYLQGYTQVWACGYGISTTWTYV